MHVGITGLLVQAIVAVLSASGYAGLAGLMAAESACLPLPSEVILPFAGYLVSQGQMNFSGWWQPSAPSAAISALPWPTPWVVTVADARWSAGASTSC